MMKLEKAKELLKSKKEEKDKINAAETLVEEDTEKQRLAEIEAEKERKRQEMKEFVASIPKSLCRPYAKCTRCGKENQLTDKALIETVDGVFRIVRCNKCYQHIIDYVNFKNSEEDTTAFEPYAYKLSGGT
jgi:putative component of membrane protein insertase Oxa1/YidC/SpoIIIJ protein YidD